VVKLDSGIGILIVFSLFFLIFQSADQGVDSYAFVLDARAGIAFFHPHHLFYNSLVHILFRVSVSLGMEAMRVISAVSSLLGALTLTFIFLTLKNRTTSAMALVLTIAMGCMHAFWSFSTSVEVNITSMMFLSLSFYLLSAGPPTARDSIAVFTLLAIGTLFHQLTALAVIPIFFYEVKRHRSFLRVMKYALPSLVTGALLYLAIGITQIQDINIVELYKWLTMYGHLGYWGTVGRGNFLISLWGIIKAVFGGDMLRQVVYGDVLTLFHIFYIVAVIFVSVGILMICGYTVYCFIKKRGAFEWLFVSLAAIYSIFGFWWTPTDAGFWLYPILSMLMLSATAIAGNRPMRKIMYVTVSIMIAVNLFYEIFPASSAKNSVALRGAAVLNELHLTSDDLLLNNLMRIRSALEYHYNTIVPTTCLGFREFGPKEQVIENYLARIDLTPGRVILFEDEINPEPHRRFMYDRFSREDYARVYGRYMDRLVSLDSIEVFGRQIRIYRID